MNLEHIFYAFSSLTMHTHIIFKCSVKDASLKPCTRNFQLAVVEKGRLSLWPDVLTNPLSRLCYSLRCVAFDLDPVLQRSSTLTGNPMWRFCTKLHWSHISMYFPYYYSAYRQFASLCMTTRYIPSLCNYLGSL